MKNFIVGQLIRQATAAPTRKVQYVGVAGLLTVVSVAAIDYTIPALGLGEIAGPHIYTAVGAAASFIGGYVARERVR